MRPEDNRQPHHSRCPRDRSLRRRGRCSRVDGPHAGRPVLILLEAGLHGHGDGDDIIVIAGAVVGGETVNGHRAGRLIIGHVQTQCLRNGPGGHIGGTVLQIGVNFFTVDVRHFQFLPVDKHAQEAAVYRRSADHHGGAEGKCQDHTVQMLASLLHIDLLSSPEYVYNA